MQNVFTYSSYTHQRETLLKKFHVRVSRLVKFSRFAKNLTLLEKFCDL